MEVNKNYRIDADMISYFVDTGHSMARPVGVQGNDLMYHVFRYEYNRGVKRDDTIVVTGDMPKFGIMHNYNEDKVAPDLIGLGDGQVWIRIKDEKVMTECWLHELDGIHTVFRPWGAEHSFQLYGIDIRLIITQAVGGGLAVRLELTNNNNKQVEVTSKFFFGRMRIITRTFSACYFSDEYQEASDTTVSIEGNIAILTAGGKIIDAVGVYADGIHPAIGNNGAEFIKNINLDAGQKSTFDLMAIYTHQDNRGELSARLNNLSFDACYKESLDYYQKLLEPYSIHTPDRVLDAAFLASIINMDYAHDGVAWVEGVHWWSAIFCNNYQISAANALGQMNHADAALRLVGMREKGPFCNTLDSFQAENIGKRDSDALPYHLYQFLQYYRMTGDTALARDLWPQYKKAIKKLFEDRDEDGDLLLDWQKGSNLFLYQADHLCMPGAGASPSLMMAGMIQQLAEVGMELGLAGADQYATLAKDMYHQIIEVLWDKESGTFYDHVDLEGIKHPAHFYTDLVFPILYTDLEGKYTWGCMEHLAKSLIYRTDAEDGLTLLRCGDLKPKWFGNDAVMTAQAAESARALILFGERELAYQIMHSLAKASTTYTDAPGEFPEWCNDEGKGIPNYIFGNPIGSFAYATVGGLFGISMTDGGKNFVWKPAFPDAWDNASMCLPYGKVSFTRQGEGRNYQATYCVSDTACAKISFELQLPIIQIDKICCNGGIVDFKLIPRINGTSVSVEVNRQSDMTELEISYKVLELQVEQKACAIIGQLSEWVLPNKVLNIIDPREVLQEVEIYQNILRGRVRGGICENTIYVLVDGINAYIPIHFTAVEPYSVVINEILVGTNNADIGLTVYVYDSTYAKDMSLSLHLFGSEQVVTILPDQQKQFFSISIPISKLAEGEYLCHYQLIAGSRIVLEETITVRPKGEGDVLKQMVAEREARTICLDITEQRNSDTILLINGWRYGDNSIVGFRQDTSYSNGILTTDFGRFDTGGLPVKLARADIARIEWDEDETVYSQYPNKISIPVGLNADMLSLFYVAEPEARHTGVILGRVCLNYEDGVQEYPLICGEHLQAINDLTQTTVGRVKVELRSCVNEYLDRGSVYRIACEGRRKLASVEIIIDHIDIQFGLIGISVLKSLEI